MKKLLVVATPIMLLISLLFSLISAKQPEIKPMLHAAVVNQPKQPEKIYPIVPNKDRMIANIQSYFKKALKKRQIAGAAIAIVKCDSIIYVDGFGNRNAKLRDTIDAETVFRIGSVSKGFGGVLTGIQVEQGTINWEDKIVDHIPNFKLANAQQTKAVTLSNVLSHTSGVPYHSFTNLVEDGLSLNTIASKFSEVWPLQKPGVEYSYQNAIFALSGEVIEKVTGKDITEVLKDKIFAPLQMNTASASYEALQKTDNVALPHQKLYGRWRPLPINKKYYNAVAAGGVNASATDMAKWMKFLLGNNPEVLSAKGLEKVFNPVIQIAGRSKYYQRWSGHQESFYSHGWRIHKFKNQNTKEINTVVHHGGHVNNYRSEIAVFPEEDLGICVLFNGPTKLARTVIPELHDIIKQVIDQPIELYQDEVVSLSQLQKYPGAINPGI